MRAEKIPFSIKQIALAAAMAFSCTQAGAVLVADGKLGSTNDPNGSAADAFAEGYQNGYNVDFLDKNGKSFGTGQVWFGTDAAGNQFLYYQLPLTYVDNTYGTNASAGWGGPGKHSFSALLGSDSMGGASVFKWTDQNAGGVQNTARIDYIASCSSDPMPSTCNTSGYASGGVGSSGTGIVDGKNGSGSKWGNVDTSLTGSAASILEIATSLEYDLKNVDPTAKTNSSLNPDWIKNVGYELEFAPGTFNPATFGSTLTLDSNGEIVSPGMILGDPHVSPPMQALGSFAPPCRINANGTCGGTAPEPGTTWMLAGGLGALGWYARKRKLSPVPS